LLLNAQAAGRDGFFVDVPPASGSGTRFSSEADHSSVPPGGPTDPVVAVIVFFFAMSARIDCRRLPPCRLFSPPPPWVQPLPPPLHFLVFSEGRRRGLDLAESGLGCRATHGAPKPVRGRSTRVCLLGLLVRLPQCGRTSAQQSVLRTEVDRRIRRGWGGIRRQRVGRVEGVRRGGPFISTRSLAIGREQARAPPTSSPPLLLEQAER